MNQKKWNVLIALLLCFCMTGCTENTNNSHSTGTQEKSVEVTGAGEEKNAMETHVSEEIDTNLYVDADFCMPQNPLYTYSTELKNFDYKEVASIVWPKVLKSKMKEDETGELCYDGGTLGGERGALIFHANANAAYIDTLCDYAKQSKMPYEKDLEFMTIEQAKSKAQNIISNLHIGCEIGEPTIVAVTGKDLEQIQSAIMKDEDYSSVLRAKNLGDDTFAASTQVYYLEYSFVLNELPVLGNNDPVVILKEDALIGHNMEAVIMISDSGIQKIEIQGAVEKFDKNAKEADIIDYAGIKESLKKKFGDVILTEKYKVINIWMEYFPLLDQGSFEQLKMIPVWCCDFEIDGKVEDYTLRFNAITGEEIS